MIEMEFSKIFTKKFPTLNEFVIRLIFQFPNDHRDVFSNDLCKFYFQTSNPEEILQKISKKKKKNLINFF